MPYLTPQELPETDICRSLSIPDNTEWLAFFGGVLTELTKTYNWEFSGGLTVAETVDKMQDIVDAYYASICEGCTLPGGGKIIRIGAHGHIEQLDDSGAWGDPTGDYVIPPPDARTGGTAADQNCLAAKNATNVLEQLYENLAESWDAHLSEAEAGTEFIGLVVGLVGFEFAPITFGVVAFFLALFGALYAALEYLGSDLWDAAFTNQMTCFLVDCASNDAGVVTFDWDCLMTRLNSLTDSFGLTELQIRLYLQVTFMLYFIGGIDGLNLAARTTDITNDDCSACDVEWCYEFLFELGEQGWTAVSPTTYSGTQYEGGFVDANSQDWAFIHIEFAPTNVTLVQMNFCKNFGAGANNGVGCSAYLSGVDVFDSYPGGHSDCPGVIDFAPELVTDQIYLNVNSGSAAGAGVAIVRVAMRGTGDNPFGEDNCA